MSQVYAYTSGGFLEKKEYCTSLLDRQVGTLQQMSKRNILQGIYVFKHNSTFILRLQWNIESDAFYSYIDIRIITRCLSARIHVHAALILYDLKGTLWIWLCSVPVSFVHEHAGDVMHVPANSFTLFSWSTGGVKMPRNTAIWQQRRWIRRRRRRRRRRRLPASKKEVNKQDVFQGFTKGIDESRWMQSQNPLAVVWQQFCLWSGVTIFPKPPNRDP